MDFKDLLKQHADRVKELISSIQTEEATKTALILPLLQILGYDVFNPQEVIPEFTCDVGSKKGEKIDYAIKKDGDAIMLIECKHCSCELNGSHDNQLRRYFMAASAKFGVLTNGIVYHFYASIDETNKMDARPFLTIDILNLSGGQADELSKFHKNNFNVANIMSAASDLKYTGSLRAIISRELEEPSPDFVRLLTRRVYEGAITAKVLEQFSALVKRSFKAHINDAVSTRLQTALDSEVKVSEKLQSEPAIIKPGKEIDTTEEEIEAYFVVKSILREKISPERIFHRDAMSYFTIILDNNNRKLVCRLYLDSPTNKQIVFLDDDKKEIRYKLNSIDDIYQHSAQIIENAVKLL